jgi:hypothetical protein
MITLPSSFVLALLVAGPAGDARPGPADPMPLREVVVGTEVSEAAAERLMVRAGWLLDENLALAGLSPTRQPRQEWGAVIAAHRDVRGRFVVSSFLGDASAAEHELARARASFPAASIISAGAPRPLDKGETPIEPSDYPYVSAGILIVASSPSYDGALRAAKRYSRRSGKPYDPYGRVFDAEYGLHFDDTYDDHLAGRYIPRRYDDEVVTVEQSDGYPGFKPHLYIVVAGIVDRRVDARERLRPARRLAPGAYVKPSRLYMGCYH